MKTKRLPGAAEEPKVQEAFGYVARAAAALERKKLFRPFEVEVEWAPGWTVRIRRREVRRGERASIPLVEKADALSAVTAISGAVSMLAMLPADGTLL